MPTASRTSPDPRTRRPFPVVTGVATVVARQDLCPGMVRFAFEDEALRALPVEAPGEIITLLWPAPGEALVLPEEGWRFPPGVTDRQHARNYTVRRWEAGSRRVEIDFVTHGDEGRASAWAETAEPGSTLGYAGSRLHWTFDPEAEWELLLADETGLPALAAIVEELPGDRRATAVIEVGGPEHEPDLRSRADLDVRWVHRGAAAPGTTSLLDEAVRDLDLPSADAVRVWGGGEAAAMRDVRTHLRDERGIPADRMSVLGYWKHRRTDAWE